MADRLVIRYYPVDGEYSTADNQSGNFGISMWAQPLAGYYDDSKPTMGAVGGSLDGDRVGGDRVWGEEYSGVGVHASTVHFDVYGLAEGGFAEQVVLLLEPDSATVRTVTRADLPLDVIVAGLGPTRTENVPGDGRPWRADHGSGGVYAGGVIEIGLYEGEAFTPLTSFWVRGLSFEPKSDGSSWANPALPPQSETLRVDADDLLGIVRATLAVQPVREPVTAFWTRLVLATEHW